MTVFEHAMVGVNLALAAGLQYRYGWKIAAITAVAAALPDWDGLSILFGSHAYAAVHRVWGHNVLTASVLGAATGAIGYHVPHIRSRSAATPDRTAHRSAAAAALWSVVGLVAALSHLMADLFYASGHNAAAPWPLQLLWPFSSQGWVFPAVPYDDLATTLFFVAEMFALYRWPKWRQTLAQLSLAAVAGYVAARWWTS